MKKYFFLISIMMSFFVFISFANAEEKISDFRVDIRLLPDASFIVDEKITYDFPDSENRHGIYRDIPTKYDRYGGKYTIEIDDVIVKDPSGQPLPFTEEKINTRLRLKIGDPNVLVQGRKEYEIQYHVRQAINYFNDHDELYWNVTGNEWQVNIDQAVAKVNLPEEISESSLATECYSGPSGANEPCLSKRYDFSSVQMVTAATFVAEMRAIGDGMTIVISLPKGALYEPTLLKKAIKFIWDNIGVLFPIVTALAMFYVWSKRGRDPQGKGTIIAQFESPDGLAPSEVGTIVDEKADNSDISSDIINLAVRGYIKIKRLEEQGVIFKSSDYTLQKLKEADSLANQFEKELMDGIFRSGSEVKISELKTKFYKDLEKIKDSIYGSVTDKGYFISNPDKVRIWYAVFGALVAFVGFLSFAFSVVQAAGLMISGILIIFFGRIMPRKTERGVAAYEHILGLKEYLSVAEKDRMEYHYAPEKNPELFEKLLPYAMALGVEERWAKQFEGIYKGTPVWYDDPQGHAFNSILLVNSLNSFSSTTRESMTATPNSGAGGGASGFGGGFSGGGFGGGGGGSW